MTAGRLLRRFEVYSRAGTLGADGRMAYLPGTHKGSMRAYVSAIAPDERLAGHQLEHPATHRLIAHGRPDVLPGDVLEREGARYFVSAVRDAGMLGLFTVITCVRRAA